MRIKFYQAGIGDCFLIDFENTEKTKFVIDTGTKTAFQHNICEDLIKELEAENNYLFLTHIDDDHIGGMIYLCEKRRSVISYFKRIYYNTFNSLKFFAPLATDNPPKTIIHCDQSGYTSYRNGVKLEDFITQFGIYIESCTTTSCPSVIDYITVKYLSPSIQTLNKYSSWVENKARSFAQTSRNTDYHKSIEELSKKVFVEDTSPTNGSSISILIEYKDYKLLFLGDSFPSDIVTSLKTMGYSKLNKLKVDIVKVSHHGSKSNTSNELLELIECNRFLISTDGKQHGHPDKEALARIICSQKSPCFIFNYDLAHIIFSEDEISKNIFSFVKNNEVNI